MGSEKSDKNGFDSYPKEAAAILTHELQIGKYMVFLQPKCTLDGELVEAEALVRYFDHNQFIAPTLFIPFFEKAKLISQIDLYVFEKICETLQDWKKQALPLIPISFNFSRETLRKGNLLSQMEAIRKTYEILPEYLIIEITESAASMNECLEKQRIEKLKEKGYPLSLDDFGVDYSNLKSFIEYPFSSLKIDKGLVDVLETNWKDRVLLANIIQVCHAFGIKVIAEGVENDKQIAFLRETKCDMIQGYYFDQPLTLDRFKAKYMKT